jgi:23S rRNA (adenine1618-N6)-methyltransferase
VHNDNKKQVEKTSLHPRNKHRERYDFLKLVNLHPGLEKFIIQTEHNTKSIDFFNPKAVIALNTALLKFYYGLNYWEFPRNYLCPAIPGRVDYIHYLADLLNEKTSGNIIRCLDIGVGANCIYPILGNLEYGWNFVASDIDKNAIESAQNILDKNKNLLINSSIDLRLQPNKSNIFSSIIQKNEYFDCSMCNPPFHESAEKAISVSERKVRNLKKTEIKNIILNFGGKANELWCEGGERQFLINMINESTLFANNVGWFTTLVSKQQNVLPAIELIKKKYVKEYRTVPMMQGNKISRFIAWRY